MIIKDLKKERYKLQVELDFYKLKKKRIEAKIAKTEKLLQETEDKL